MKKSSALTTATFADLVDLIRQTHQELAAQANKAVNVSLTFRNWLIGRHIAEYELGGRDRAQYGKQRLTELARELKSVSNCNQRQLYRYLRFYRLYPAIVGTLPPQFKNLPRVAEPAENTEEKKVGTLVELKLERFSHENLGQLNTYVSWYRAHMMTEGDNPPVGILLCTDKNHALAEYALAGMDNQLFVAKYQLELPKKEEMQRFIDQQLKEVTEGDGVIQ